MDLPISSLPALILKSDDAEISKITSLTTSPFLIGRGAESSLKLRQKSISRKQCCIERNGTNWEIKSLGSRPLTVSGNLLFEDSAKILKCTDIIELPGAIKFEFRCAPDQNGRCCKDSEAGISIVSLNDSRDFPIAQPNQCASTPASSNNSASVDEPSCDGSSCVVEVPTFNADDHVKVAVPSDSAPIKSSALILPNLGLLLETNQNSNVTQKQKGSASGDISNHTDDESDLIKKVKWQEAKIQFLQMKLKEKENVSSQLESLKSDNDTLVNKVSELKRTLASKDIMELEFRVLQESVKYKEEDKRSKDILQEQIDTLQSESSLMKIESEKLVADLENLKNKNAEIMEKYKIMEEKLNEKTNSIEALGSIKDGNADSQCCEVGAARSFALMEIMERELNCSICGEMFIQPTVTNCNHTFCTHCLREWKKMKRECPFCRTVVVHEFRISFLDELINKSLKFLSPKLLDERLQLIQERIAPPIQPPPAKRQRGRARQPARVPRNVRGLQNPPVAIPHYVDPISGFLENFLEDMAPRMIFMGPGLQD